MACNLPGIDFQVMKLLGLDLSVKRLMLYQQGCNGGGTVLRIVKDLAENNKGARGLIVCSEVIMIGFRGLHDNDFEALVTHSLFGDSAASLVVGANPIPGVEKPIFELVFTAPTLLPDSSMAINGKIRECGLLISIRKEVPSLISKHIEHRLVEVFHPWGISNWNSIFWVAHPGGPVILEQIEAKLGLKPEKLRATRDVLADYGNLSSVTVLFVLDEMRRKSIEERHKTTRMGSAFWVWTWTYY